MIKAKPKYPTDLYGNIYIDNIQKAVVICLIIPTTFPFDAGSSDVTSEKCIIFEDPASKGNVVRQSQVSVYKYEIYLPEQEDTGVSHTSE